MALLPTAIALAQPKTSAAGDWQIIKVSGQDYLSVENISRFYGLPAGVVDAGEKIRFETIKNPLEFVSGSRETMVNGARSWLCFPLIEQGGKYLVSRTDVAKTIEPLVRPHRVPNVGKVQTVVLDPGHGGYDHFDDSLIQSFWARSLSAFQPVAATSQFTMVRWAWAC